MLVDEIRKQRTQALRDGDPVAKTILGLALGEIQADEARKGRALTDEEGAAAVRKLVKSNEETLGLTTDEAAAATLRRELEVLKALLPKGMSVDELRAILASDKEAIVAAKSEGQATGVAMKLLKARGLSVGGSEVAAVVKELRGG